MGQFLDKHINKILRHLFDPVRGLRWMIMLALLTPMPYALAQLGYAGTIGIQPIHLFAYVYGDGVVRAMYVYDKFDTPIQVDGKLVGGVLELHEQNDHKGESAILRFEHFDMTQENVSGEWYRTDLSKRLPIVMKKEFVVEDGENLEASPLELTQAAATRDLYFKTRVVKQKDEYYPRVSAIKVFKKGTDVLLQTFNVDVEYRGVDNVSVDDYNFDGIEDFSVFESSYAGPDTSSLYFLRVPGAERFVESDFGGSSLEFDPAAKLIHEHSQCCAGTKHMSATYKVVKNKMVLVERKCFELDEEQGDLVTVKCE